MTKKVVLIVLGAVLLLCGLGCAVPCDERLVRDPAWRHDLGPKHWQHDVPAAEHQRADAVEAVKEGQPLGRPRQPEQRQAGVRHVVYASTGGAIYGEAGLAKCITVSTSPGTCR